VPEFLATLIAEIRLTEHADHVFAALSPLNVDFTLGTDLGVLLSVVHLVGPVLEHLVALAELGAGDVVVPGRMTLKAPDQVTLAALHLGHL